MMKMDELTDGMTVERYPFVHSCGKGRRGSEVDLRRCGVKELPRRRDDQGAWSSGLGFSGANYLFRDNHC